MDNSTTFQGNGEVVYVPVIVNGKQARQTNGDRIRSMSDEELAEYLSYLEFPYRPVYAKKDEREWLDWLKKERER